MYVTAYVDNTKYGQSSVMDLAAYLEKESLIQDQLGGLSSRQLSAYLDKQNDVVRVEGHEYFFNGSSNTFDSEDVTKTIDANVKGLKKKEARYYTFSISPSEQEIAHLRRTIGDTRQALIEAGEAIPEGFEDSIMRSHLKEYAVKCMDAYAQNFGHPQVKDNHDLLWFGMVEKDRYWKKGDSHVRINAKIDKDIEQLRGRINEVNETEISRKIAALEKKYIRENKVRAGGSNEILRPMMAKTGDNWHVHVTTSRRDATNSFNLSPNANGRGSKKHKLNGQSVRVGFNRETYKIRCEQVFDKTFGHSRLLTESYEEAKRLRQKSAFAFEKQLVRDRETRRRESLEFSRLNANSYSEYYENLLQVESLDARQLMQVKGYLVRQIRMANPHLNTEELMDHSLDELQSELARLDAAQEVSLPNWAEGAAANIGDKVIQTTGLQGYNPIHTTRKVLRSGIAMRRAINRRREVYDNWTGIYTTAWHRENYLFDSISAYRNTDCLLAQTEYLEAKLGHSVILLNADRYMADIEQQFVADFLKENWAERQPDAINQYAVEMFGKDAVSVRQQPDFETMARERLLPEDARRSVAELARRCEQPRDLADLRTQISRHQPEQVKTRTDKLESFAPERGQRIERIREILKDTTLTAHAKEESLLKLALEDKELNKALRDLRKGILNVFEKQHPDMKYGSLQKQLGDLFKELAEVQIQRQAEFAAVIDVFIGQELPDYYLVVEKQSQLEQLLREITPDPQKYAERLIEVNNDLMQQLSPHAETLFERHGQRLFGAEVHLKNEHDFVAYVEKTCTPEQAQRYKQSLRQVYTKIEDKRRVLIQNYASTKIPAKELNEVRRQQGYMNRYISKTCAADVAKSKKEQLQRCVAGTCKRPVITPPVYRIFGPAARNRVAAQALVKANLVKIIPITPQQLIIKSAFKLLNILTKGY